MRTHPINTLLFLALALLARPATAQVTNCYESLLAKGQALYDQKDYENALKRWRAALSDCPELTEARRNTLREKIRLAENPPAAPPATAVVGDMALIRGGTYRMGNVLNDPEGSSDEKPVHNVTVSDFYLSKHELSFAEYDAFCAATGREKPSDAGWGRGQRPIMNTDWYDAIEYCNWRSRREGLAECYTVDKNTKDPNNSNSGDTKKWTVRWNTNAKGYRLPTEAEWEYAARERGRDVRFGNGRDIIDPSEVNFDATADYKKIYSIVGVYRQQTVSVQDLSANSLGLKNMSGNVYEWCWDWYDAAFYAQSEGARNPQGPTGGSYRVVRGGSWSYFPQNCRAAGRLNGAPGDRGDDLGFRLARTL